MHYSKPGKQTRARMLALGYLLLASVSTLADTSTDAQRQQQFQKDSAVCQSGASNQSRQDCQREAGAVRQQGTTTAPPADGARLQANAEQRCAVLAEPDRGSCLRRMRGAGSVSGSVGGGGIYRELTEPAAQQPAQEPAPAPAQ